MLMKRVATCAHEAPTETARQHPGALRHCVPARHSEHRSGALRASARADSLSFRPGRPHALTAFALTPYGLRRPSPAGWVLGAPPARPGHPAPHPPWTGGRCPADTLRTEVPRTASGVRGFAPQTRPSRGRLYFGWGRNSGLAPPRSSARPPRAPAGRRHTHFVGPGPGRALSLTTMATASLTLASLAARPNPMPSRASNWAVVITTWPVVMQLCGFQL